LAASSCTTASWKERTRTATSGRSYYFLRSDAGWFLVDAGWQSDRAHIAQAAVPLFGVGSRPENILLTHCHPDHAGAALDLARGWDREVLMHPAELPIATGDFEAMRAFAGPLDRWVVLPIMRAMGGRRREAVLSRSSMGEVARPFDPGGEVPGLPGWQCLPTPGHTPGHVAFYRPADRILISGDALVTLRVNSPLGLLGRQGLSGPPWYTTWDRKAASDSVMAMARLEPTVLCPGHGTPVTDPNLAAAIRAFAGLDSGA
jgi:glyoxylase-like metal-dependent hydrolase (beta-lactamase superfamily II)